MDYTGRVCVCVCVTCLSQDKLATIPIKQFPLLIYDLTGCGFAIMVVDVVVGFILLVLTQDVLAGHPGDDRQVSWGSLGYGRITPVQEELAVIDDPGSCNKMHTKVQLLRK